jgi:hypothetical protein
MQFNIKDTLMKETLILPTRWMNEWTFTLNPHLNGMQWQMQKLYTTDMIQ